MKDVIHFYRVSNLDLARKFYSDILGFKLYKDQVDCLIYDVEGISKIGFCLFSKEFILCDSIITFVYETTDEIDHMYHLLKSRLLTPLDITTNEKYQIYHFFVNDFNGLKVEFQVFLDEDH